MKKVTLVLLMALMGLATGFAQTAEEAVEQAVTLKYGFLSYQTVMEGMAEYADMQKNMTEMRSQYEAEMKRVEDDFNKKYEEFLDGQKSFPKTILQKRQSELQEMLDKNIAFKKESKRMLDDSEATMLNTIRAVVQSAVETVAQERGYAFVLDTDVKAATWLNPSMGEDMTEAVKALLNQ